MEGGKDDITSLRVASFSCYLDTAKENLIHKISAQDQVPIMLSSVKPQQPPTKPVPLITHSNDSHRIDSFSYLKTPFQDPTPLIAFPREARKNGEISIFGADKYFSMKLDYQMEMIKNEVNLGRVGSNAKPRNPSSCSETTTCNGQTAKLHRNGSQTKHIKRGFARRILLGFGCKGPCFDKKDVISINRTGSQISHGVAIPPINETQNLTAKEEEEDQVANMEESRTSIEVFGSKALLKGDYIAKNMERKLSMLTWDAIPKAKNLQTTIESSTICDDMASEVSSDLFEIENISGSTMHRIMAADDVSMSPASHYAPSEASIQWSVVTGSAVDCKDETSIAGHDVITAKKETKSTCKSRNGGLLGCKSLKGVDVADNVLQKGNEKTKHQGLPLSLSLATHSKMLNIIN